MAMADELEDLGTINMGDSASVARAVMKLDPHAACHGFEATTMCMADMLGLLLALALRAGVPKEVIERELRPHTEAIFAGVCALDVYCQHAMHGPWEDEGCYEDDEPPEDLAAGLH